MKKVILIGVAVLGLSACSCNAEAAVLGEIANPSVEFTHTPYGYVQYSQVNYDADALGISNDGSKEHEYINSIFGTTYTGLSQLAYKAEGNKDFGPFADLYVPNISESNFEINWANVWDDEITDFMDCSEACYLAVKDGTAGLDRPYLFFDITGWDGQSRLSGSQMWMAYNEPYDGTKSSYASISHLSIWQGEVPVFDKPPSNVPEPMPLMLMGVGLLGIAFSRKYKLTK